MTKITKKGFLIKTNIQEIKFLRKKMKIKELFIPKYSLSQQLYNITRWKEVENIVYALRQARRQGFVDIYILRQINLPINPKIRYPKELRLKVFEIFR